MKRLILSAIVAACLVTSAEAQETYSVNLNTAGAVADIDLGRVDFIERVCTSLNLSIGCTQAQACVAKGVTGGASCTTPDAIAAGVRIYPNSLAGRESFITNELVRAKRTEFVQRAAEKAVAAQGVFCKTANATQENSICSAVGLPNDCKICSAYK